MENLWQTAKRILTVEEAKKCSDAAHAYSLEIGNPRTRPPLKELEQYLVPLQRTHVYHLLQQREAGTLITTGRTETLIHSIETYLPTIESKTQDVKDEELFDIFFNGCQLPSHSCKHINRALELVTHNCHSTSLPELDSSLTTRSE